jgi:hypothetical protein
MTIDRRTLQNFASRAGFGANLRNTHAVKLELFAKYVEAHTLDHTAKAIVAGVEAFREVAEKGPQP